MRKIAQRCWLAILTVWIIPTAAHAFHRQKYENRPDKIGHRNVAHRSFISPEKELAVGRQYAQQYERAIQLVQDPWVVQYVAEVGRKVAENSDWEGQITVKVVKSPEVRSFSLPGGFLYISSGLLLAAANEDEVASAIAHQLAHAAARHWAAEITRQTILQYDVLPATNDPATPAGQLQKASNQAAISPQVCAGFPIPNPGPSKTAMAFLKFRREDELEADYLALQYLYKAGYSASAYIRLLQRFAPQNATSRSMPDILRATPPLSERVSNAEKEISKILPGASSPPRSDTAFNQMKSILQH